MSRIGECAVTGPAKAEPGE